MSGSVRGRKAPFLLSSLAGWLGLLRRLLAGMDRGGVTADMAGEFVAIVGLDQRLVDLLRTTVAGEGVEGA